MTRRAGFRALLALLVMPSLGCSRIVILSDPLSGAEHNDLGVAYEAKGQTELAAREYRRALRRDPRLGRARFNLGNLEAAAGRWRQAERCYRSALRDIPGDADARNNLAEALRQLGKNLDEAEWLARSAVALAGERDSLHRATLTEILFARRRLQGPAREAP